MIRALRLAVTGALAVLAATSLSCHVNEYCLNCDTGDGGGGDGGPIDGSNGSGGMDGSNGSQCAPAIEVCDGIDNDCDGKVDEDVDVGSNTCNQMGACSGAVPICKEHGSGSADIECSKQPTAEVCDNVDNDCDGVIDNNNPLVDSMGMVHGAKCGNGVGECKQGNNICSNGTISCVGAVGPTTEVCDGRDNDCDGTIDNGLASLGACGPGSGLSAPCSAGTFECLGGGVVCVGGTGPTLEVCDGVDNDCDGTIDNGFDTATDPRNCGTCGTICSFPNAVAGCSGSACFLQACEPGFHDANHKASDGCEYACNATTPPGTELCDGKDNDCDGLIDNGATPPANFCLTKGACLGATASCQGSDGFECDYGSAVQLGSNGQPVNQETLCDNKDNDCDGRIDEGTPNLGAPCQVGTCKTTGGDCFGSADCTGAGNTCLFSGVCGGTGHFVCDGSNAAGPAICKVDTHGKKPGAESCNNLDDDCDGAIDNGGSAGNLVGQNWVSIGNNIQMMQFEASKPDASGSDQGNVVAGTVCSQKGVLPWTDVTHPEAEAECEAVGARLCTEQEWHRTCSVIAPLSEVSPASTVYPIVLPASGTITTTFEAEDYETNTFATGDAVRDVQHRRRSVRPIGNSAECAAKTCNGKSGSKHCSLDNTTCTGNGELRSADVYDRLGAGTPHAWVEDYTQGFSGISDMEALPDVGDFETAAAARHALAADGLHVHDEQGDRHVPRVGAARGAGDPALRPARASSCYIGFDGGTPVAVTTGATETDVRHGRPPATTFTLAVGAHTMNVYMGQDGVRLDALQITDTTNTPTLPTNSPGNNWAYATSANTYQPGTCNGEDFSPTDDNIQPTGNELSCFAATGTDVFDMSGNVKEWAGARLPGENPIRGGASDDDDQGISCPLELHARGRQLLLPERRLPLLSRAPVAVARCERCLFAARACVCAAIPTRRHAHARHHRAAPPRAAPVVELGAAGAPRAAEQRARRLRRPRARCPSWLVRARGCCSPRASRCAPRRRRRRAR